MARRDDAPRDLLFGLLALQNGMVGRDQLAAAFGAWTASDRPMADILVAQGALSPPRRALLDALAAEHLAAHGNDPEKSLAALDLNRSTRESLAAAGGPQVEATLTHVGSGPGSNGDADRTASYSVGAATSDGQRFRVLRPHARGGLGAVFVALDDELHREVALKQILDRHADEPTSRHRFLLEAEITGGLEHPGIVPVYGLGTYGDGRPYYAMRFIRGDSLKEAIERFHADGAPKSDPGRRSLELRKLLRRFLDVCNAIDYAHARGVLHRDIKPGNIIVGKHGETLVVDWGLAKASGRADVDSADGERPLVPSSASGSAETLPGSALGTPAYMSPEQARGDLDALGPASDVYSLGGTLYCLLTGRPPFEGDDLGEILRAVGRGDVRPPRALEPTIDRALEAICLKAMATRAQDRYPSARALADDVERWMADEPVAAYRDPPLRRAGRWARRHRPLVAGAAVLLVSAVVGLSVGAVMINRERSKAEENFRRARAAVDEYFTTVSESKLLDVPGLQPLRKELLDSARRYYEDFLRERADDHSVRGEAAAALVRMAYVTGLVDRGEEALAIYGRAIALYQDLIRGRPGEAAHRSDQAYVYATRGLLLSGLGRRDEARRDQDKALALRDELARASPDNPNFQADLARSHRIIGDLMISAGKLTEGESHMQEARSIDEAILRDPPPPGGPRHHLSGRLDAATTARQDLGDCLSSLAGLYRESGRFQLALDAHRRACELYEAMLLERPGDVELRHTLAGHRNGLALTLVVLRRNDEAREASERAIGSLEVLVAENPSVKDYRVTLADACLNAGFALENSGRAEEALRSYRRATELSEALVAADPRSVPSRLSQAMGLGYMGRVHRAAGRTAEAVPLLRRSIILLEGLARDVPQEAKYPFELAMALRGLGRAERDSGHRAEALAAADRARELDAALSDRFAVACWNLAIDLALAAGVAGPDRREAYAAASVEAFRRAVRMGYPWNGQSMKAEAANPKSDLQVLHDRDDFCGLVMDLAFPADPFARGG